MIVEDAEDAVRALKEKQEHELWFGANGTVTQSESCPGYFIEQEDQKSIDAFLKMWDELIKK